MDRIARLHYPKWVPSYGKEISIAWLARAEREATKRQNYCKESLTSCKLKSQALTTSKRFFIIEYGGSWKNKESKEKRSKFVTIQHVLKFIYWCLTTRERTIQFRSQEFKFSCWHASFTKHLLEEWWHVRSELYESKEYGPFKKYWIDTGREWISSSIFIEYYWACTKPTGQKTSACGFFREYKPWRITRDQSKPWFECLR